MTLNDPQRPSMTLNDPRRRVRYCASNASTAIYISSKKMFSSDDDWNVEDKLSFDFSCLSSPEKKPRVEVANFDSKMTFKGYEYTKKTTATNGGHAFYQCKSYCSPHFCKASIKYTSEGVIIERETGQTCKQNDQLKSIMVGEINDVQAEMRQMIIDSCLDDATKSATEVAKHVFETTVQKYEGIFVYITLQLRSNLK